MPNETQIEETQEYLERQLLPLVGGDAFEWQPTQLEQLKSRLYLLRHFCGRAGFSEPVREILDSLIALTADLWQLLHDTTANVDSEKQYVRVRTLAAEAEGLTNAEEILSGEDTIRDIIINSIAFALNWKSNTIWIDEAIKERVGMARTGLATLEAHVWRLLDERATGNSELSLAELAELGTSMEQLWQIMNGLPTEIQLHLLIQLYANLLRLEMSRLRETLATS